MQPLFRQPEEEDDPAEQARRAARNVVAPLWATPLVIGDDPPELIRWAADRAARLESDDATRAERVYSARGLVRAYEDLKALERRAPRADDGALEYSNFGDLAPWSADRPHTVDEIAPFTHAAVRQWQALGSLDPDAGTPAAAAGPIQRAPRGRAGPQPDPPGAQPAGRRAAPPTHFNTVKLTKTAGLDADTDEGKLEIEARLIHALYPGLDDLLLSWVVSKLGIKLPTGESRFTDTWLKTFRDAEEGHRVELPVDEYLKGEINKLLDQAPNRVGLIGQEVYRNSYGMHYILAIEFAAALVAFTGGAALGAAAAEGGSVAITTTAMELEGGGAVAGDVGAGAVAADTAASQSFGTMVRSGVASWTRGAILSAPSAYQWGTVGVAAATGAKGLADVAADVQAHGLHAYQLGDIAGAFASIGEAYLAMPEAASPASTAPSARQRRPVPDEPDIIVERLPSLDPTTRTVRSSIREVRTGIAYDAEIDPVTQNGQITDRTTGAVVGVIRGGRMSRPDTDPDQPPSGPGPSAPRGGTPPGTPPPPPPPPARAPLALPAPPPARAPLALPAPPASAQQPLPAPPRGAAPALPAPRVGTSASGAGAPTGRSYTGARIDSPGQEEDYAGSTRPARLPGGPFYARPPAGSRGPTGTPAVRPPRAPAVRPTAAPATPAPAVRPSRAPATRQPAAPADPNPTVRPSRAPTTRQPATPARRPATPPARQPATPATRPARAPTTRQPAASIARQSTVPAEVPSWNDMGFRRRALAQPRGQRVPLLSLAPDTDNNPVEMVLRDVDPQQLQASFGGQQVYVWRRGSRILYVGKSGGMGGEVLEPGVRSPTPSNWVNRAQEHLQKRPEVAAATSVTVYYDLTMDEAFALETSYINDETNPPELNIRAGDFDENYGQGSPDYAANLASAQRGPQVTFNVARLTPSPDNFLP